MTSPPSDTVFEAVLLHGAMIGAWVLGEGGKAAMAGAAGGVVRWLSSERRKVSEGVIAVVTGAMMAHYGTPLMLALIEGWTGELKGEAMPAAAFFAGLVGMSLGKLVIAFMDNHARKVRGGGQ